MSKPLQFSVEQEFQISVDHAWDLLSDTENLNRATGMPEVFYGKPRVEDSGFYRSASSKFLGLFETRWREYPFEWTKPEKYSVMREFENGPLERFLGGVEIKKTSSGILMRAFADITPRGFLGKPIVNLIGKKGVREILKYCAKCFRGDKSKQKVAVRKFPATSSIVTPMSGKFETLVARLATYSSLTPDLIEGFKTHLKESPDHRVMRMRCFALADEWKADRDQVLRLFLYATKEGLLHLDWELMCPNCRVPKKEYRSLNDVSENFHCDLCGTNYDADMDRYIELRFSVNQEIRQAQDAVYCVGGPVNAAHIQIQCHLKPGEERDTMVDLGADFFRFRSMKFNRSAPLTPVNKSGSAHIPEIIFATYSDDGWQLNSEFFKPGTTTIRWKNQGSKSLLGVLEKEPWDDQAVTAARVTSLQEFRTLFSSEVLAPGKQIGIRNLCILFTDLKQSTILYETIGDAPAYGRVSRHFDYLLRKVAQNRGAIVKTIGDAVMAVFPTAADGVRAGMQIQNGFEEFNDEGKISPPLVIRIGFHHGSAIAVNANGQLDYFGRTVNIAARIQNESLGSDIVMAEEIFQESEVQQVLKEYPHTMTKYEVVLKGIDTQVKLCRLYPSLQKYRSAKNAV